MKTSHLRLRLEWTDHDACRRFHRDNVRLRLICTYSGPGTEYGLAPERGHVPHRVFHVPPDISDDF